MPATNRLPQSTCRRCEAVLDHATAVHGGGFGPNDAPEPGDVTVCVACGTVSVFDEDRQLRAPTDEEIEEIAAHPDLVHMILAIQQALIAIVIQQESTAPPLISYPVLMPRHSRELS
jgi:hypothetical protein